MVILTVVIGALLLAAGLGGLAMSVDLLPTDMGRLYVECGAIFLAASGVVFAIAALIVSLNRTIAPPRGGQAEQPTAPPVAETPAAAPPPPPADDVNLNRSGRLPSLHAVEEALVGVDDPPQVIGRYAQGGARYVVFSNGAIEAETAEGGLRFASMDEFKAYIAARKG